MACKGSLRCHVCPYMAFLRPANHGPGQIQVTYLTVCSCVHALLSEPNNSLSGHNGWLSRHHNLLSGHHYLLSEHHHWLSGHYNCFRACLRPCVFVDFAVAAIRPTTLLRKKKGKQYTCHPSHRAASPDEGCLSWRALAREFDRHLVGTCSFF